MNKLFKKIYGCSKVVLMLTFIGIGAFAFTPREAFANPSFFVVGETKNL